MLSIKKLQRGFTLIEMLVVIAIISILIGIGVNTFTIAQKKARDVRRKADLHQIQVALELYKQDNGHYPYSGSCSSSWCRSSDTNSDWIPGLSPTYIDKVPNDPKSPDGDGLDGDQGYTYYDVLSTGYNNGYTLAANLENTNDPDRCAVKLYNASYPAAGYGYCNASVRPNAYEIYGLN